MIQTKERLAYTPDEVARLLGVCTRTIIRSMDAGKIHCFSIGKRRLIAKAEVERILNEGAETK